MSYAADVLGPALVANGWAVFAIETAMFLLLVCPLWLSAQSSTSDARLVTFWCSDQLAALTIVRSCSK